MQDHVYVGDWKAKIETSLVLMKRERTVIDDTISRITRIIEALENQRLSPLAQKVLKGHVDLLATAQAIRELAAEIQ